MPAEQIAVLDGLSMVADGVPGYTGRSYEPSPSDGGNLIGGSNWFDGAPYRLQQEGLAGLGSALSMDPVGAYAGGAYTPEPGEGALYVGGSNWYPGAPTRVSSEGLAGSLSVEPVPGWAGASVNPVPGAGANYTGGSDWSMDFPTRVSSQGLVGAATGAAPPPWRFPLYDERDARILKLLGCGAARMYQAIYGIVRPLEVRNCAETVMSRLRNSGQIDQLYAASAQDVAYLGALYVASKYPTSWAPGYAKTRARAVSQTCGG